MIAIDGPTAAGKGTLARRLADRLGFAYLDTGSLYRAVAARLLRDGRSPGDAAAAVAAARALGPADLAAGDLRAEATGAAASVVAALPEVRAALLDYQRDFAARPPGGRSGAVLVGRDIGTVVCPDAAVKLFVTASPEVRAARRHRELLERGEAADPAAVRADLEARDARDSARATAPLVQMPDAHLLDTSGLDIEGAVQAALDIVAEACPSVCVRRQGESGAGP